MLKRFFTLMSDESGAHLWLLGAFDLAIFVGKKEDSCYGEVEKKVEGGGDVYKSKKSTSRASNMWDEQAVGGGGGGQRSTLRTT